MTQTALNMPSQPAMIPAARAYLREIFIAAGFDDADAAADGARAALSLLIDRTADPANPSNVAITTDLTPAALTVSFADQGLPFDPSSSQTLTPPGRHDDGDRSASKMIRQVFDEAKWLNLGRQGMQLVVSKHRQQRDVTSRFSARDLAPYVEDVPLAPPQQYTIRRLLPEEAIGVAQCIYRTYGYSYPNDDLYYPERIVEQNADGRLVSAVTIDAAGDLVGHYALERPDLGPIAESGQAVVVPAHRGRGLMEQMRTFLWDEARAIGLAGIYSQPVTVHTASQKVNERFNAKLCGISFAFTPATISFKAIGEPVTQRVSLMLYYTPLVPADPAPRYVPERHAAIIGRIYDQIGVTISPREPVPPLGIGDVEVSYARTLRQATIRVHSIGADTIIELRRAQRDLVDTGAVDVIYLELPLSHPSTPIVARQAEVSGFFFSGIGPRFARNGDALRLQYIATAYDPSRIEIASAFGHELRDYIVADWNRVRSPSL